MATTHQLERRERVALALYKAAHPQYAHGDFSSVASLPTVLYYRELAEAAIAAYEA
jgi:hypothetical protein